MPGKVPSVPTTSVLVMQTSAIARLNLRMRRRKMAVKEKSTIPNLAENKNGWWGGGGDEDDSPGFCC